MDRFRHQLRCTSGVLLLRKHTSFGQLRISSIGETGECLASYIFYFPIDFSLVLFPGATHGRDSGMKTTQEFPMSKWAVAILMPQYIRGTLWDGTFHLATQERGAFRLKVGR
jgi:hypothetical protein